MLKCYGTDLREMAGDGLAGTQSQAILGCPGQVMQQAEIHWHVLLTSHTVLQFLYAAGKLIGKKETVTQ